MFLLFHESPLELSNCQVCNGISVKLISDEKEVADQCERTRTQGSDTFGQNDRILDWSCIVTPFKNVIIRP